MFSYTGLDPNQASDMRDSHVYILISGRISVPGREFCFQHKYNCARLVKLKQGLILECSQQYQREACRTGN